MKIEIILDDYGFIGGVRTNWSKKAVNPPRPENVYNIPKLEFERLINFLVGRMVKKAEKREKADFEYGNLRLVALDLQNPEVLKGKNFGNFLETK